MSPWGTRLGAEKLRPDTNVTKSVLTPVTGVVNLGPMAKKAPLAKEDLGAAMMAWYADAIKQYPEGLVTQAQAAEMLGIGRMAVSRLVARGYLRAVYFPRPPNVVGVTVGHDDPTWLKILGWLDLGGGDEQIWAFPKACYVAFADVRRLWETGDAKKKCARDWEEILAMAGPTKKGIARVRTIQARTRRTADAERGSRERQT